jgi:hypothetical protein
VEQLDRGKGLPDNSQEPAQSKTSADATPGIDMHCLVQGGAHVCPDAFKATVGPVATAYSCLVGWVLRWLADGSPAALIRVRPIRGRLPAARLGNLPGSAGLTALLHWEGCPAIPTVCFLGKVWA